MQSGAPTATTCKSKSLNVQTVRGNLTVDKFPSLQFGTFGETVSWILTLRNTGLGTIYSATLTDTIGGGYVNVTSPSPTAPVDIAPNAAITYTVAGTIASCTNLTNTVGASWSIGNADGSGTSANPVPDFTDIIFQLTDPVVAVEIGALNTVPYCGALDQSVPITVTNTGGAATDLRLSLNAVNLNVTEESSVWSQAGNVLTYTGGTPPGTLGKNQTITFTVRVTSTNACATSPASLNLRPVYYDACKLMQTSGSAASASQTLAPTAPTLDVTKIGPVAVNTGQVFQYQVDVTGANRQMLNNGGYTINDSLPVGLNLISAGAAQGTVITSGNAITWTIPKGIATSLNASMTITTQAPINAATCGGGTSVVNTANASASVCPECTLADSASVTTYIQEVLSPTNTFSLASTPIEPCYAGSQPVTATINLANPITWTGTIYTDTLVSGSFSVVGGTPKVFVERGGSHQ